MPNVYYVFWVLLGALVAFLMILYFMLGQTSTSLTANTLNSAVHSSIEYARDNSMRTSRGAYVINVNKFRKHLDEYHIKDLSGFHVSNNDQKNEDRIDKKVVHKNAFAIRFLLDDQRDTKSNHDWINADKYPSERHVDIPVRMIQVQAIPDTRVLRTATNEDQWKMAMNLYPSRKFVSTYAVDVQDNKQDPVKEPNLNEHSKADLTDNEYTDEGGHHQPISSKTTPLSHGEM